MIKKILDGYYEENQQTSREHKDRFYPAQSSVHVAYPKYKKLEGKCLRAAYYNAMGIAEDIVADTTKRLIFEIGDYTEKMLLDILSKKGILLEKNKKFEVPKYNIVGKLDGILLIDNEKVGLEVKSIGSNKYSINHIFGSKWNKPYPKWQNLFQTLIYCYAFRSEIDKFILFYIRRDTCEIKEFIVSIIPKNGKIYPVIDGEIDERFTVNDLLERFRILYKYVQKEKAPPREYIPIYAEENLKTYEKLGIISKFQYDKYYQESPFGDMECAWCGYSSICSKDLDKL